MGRGQSNEHSHESLELEERRRRLARIHELNVLIAQNYKRGRPVDSQGWQALGQANARLFQEIAALYHDDPVESGRAEREADFWEHIAATGKVSHTKWQAVMRDAITFASEVGAEDVASWAEDAISQSNP